MMMMMMMMMGFWLMAPSLLPFLAKPISSILIFDFLLIARKEPTTPIFLV
jgi:hypothetical protein